MRARRALRSALLAGFAWLLLAPWPAAAQVFEERQSVVAVEVAVQVLRDGQPLRGLGRDDFELYEGDRRQEITGFEVVDLAALAPDVAPELRVARVPAAGRRHFLLLFDLVFASPARLARAQDAARALVATRLHPTDLVAVAIYSARHGARLILGFTSDRAQIDLALDTLGAPQLIERSPDSLALTIGRTKAELEQELLRAGGLKAAAIAQLLEQAKSDLAAVERAATETARNRVVGLTRSFADLGRVMQAVQGRKFVLYFSEGFDASLLLGSQEAQQQSREELERVDLRTLMRADPERLYGSSRLLADVDRMLEEFRRADCVIESIDVGGARATRALDPAAEQAPSGALGERAPSGEDSLFILAERTGGDLYRNFNDLGEALARSLARSSVTYVLTFQPRDAPADGSYRPIEVRLACPERGAVVRHRAGYFAPGGDRPRLQQKLELADLVLGGEAGGTIDGALFAAALRGDGPQARVAVVVEATGPALLAGHDVDLLTVEVYAYAFDAGGAIAGTFAHTVGLNLLKVGDQLRATGLKLYGELSLAPGDYDLRVLVRDAQTGRHGLAATPLVVPDFAAGAPRLAAPLFLDADDWLVAKAPSSEPHPLSLGGRAFVPAASVEVARDGRARFCLLAYDLPGAAARLETRLLDTAGRERVHRPLEVEELDAAAPAGARQFLASLSVAGLDAGAYTLELRLRDAAGAELARASSALRVD